MSDDENNPDWYKAQIDNRIGWFKQLPGVTFADYVPPLPPPEKTEGIFIPTPGATLEIRQAILNTLHNARLV